MTREEMIADAQSAKDAGDHELEMHIYQQLESMQSSEPAKPSGNPDELLAKLKWSDVPGKSAENLPKSIQGVGQGVINTVSHPIDTAQSVLDLANAGMQKVLPQSLVDLMPDKTKDNPAKLSAVGDFYANRYGSEEGFKQALAEDPAGVLLDASTALGGISWFSKGIKGIVSPKYEAALAEANKVNALSAPKAGILEEAIKSGYVMPPSGVNPSFWNKRLESIGGKAAVRQDAIIRNQENFVNQLVRKELGLADDAPITGEALRGIRDKSGLPYKEVSELPTAPSLANGYSINSKAQTLSKSDLQALKQARNDSQGWQKAYERSASPDDLTKAKLAEAEASRLEQLFIDRAKDAGKPDLMSQLKKARTEIAKTYNVDSARNVATGDIDPIVLGRIMDKNPQLLTGELKKIAETQQAFPQYLGDATKVPTPGVSKSEALAAMGMSGMGAATAGVPGLLAGGIPLISEPIRNLIFSQWYQEMMTKLPKKEVSRALKMLNNLPDKGTSTTQNALNLMYQAGRNK